MISTCSGQHKSRLFVGEGNFSFTEAFIQKHDKAAGHDEDSSLAHSITATDLPSCIQCISCLVKSARQMKLNENTESEGTSSEIDEDPDGLGTKWKTTHPCEDHLPIVKRIENLHKQGVDIVLGVDATTMSTKFEGRKFDRIHWNCPHDGSNFRNQTLPPMIDQFFKESSKMQNPGGCIHISIPQPSAQEGFRQGYVYDLSKGARKAGYALVKKRNFEKDRYPGYQHSQTNSFEKASVTDKGVREFVFEKVDYVTFHEINQKAKNPKGKGLLILPRLKGLAKVSEKTQKIVSEVFYDCPRAYYVCSTDEDSSDCEAES